jgi:hypothetical protein
MANEHLLTAESILLRRVASTALILGSLTACARTHDDVIPPVVEPPASGWVVAREGDSLRISIDTAGLAPHDTAPILWVAVNDVSTPAHRASSSPFLRFETRQQIDCASQRARGLDSRIPDSTGAWRIHPVQDSAWQRFDSARLPSPILRAACDKLRDLHSQPPSRLPSNER